jgi:type III secretion protein C
LTLAGILLLDTGRGQSPTPDPASPGGLTGAPSIGIPASGGPSRLLPWTSSKAWVVAQGRPIGQVLADFGEQQGIKIIVDPEVTGTLSGEFQGLAPAYFLDQIARAYNLTWFYAGGILYISPAKDIRVVTQTLRFVPAERVIQTVNQAIPLSLDGRITVLPQTEMLMISGSPRYVELVRNIVGTMDAQQEFRQTGETVVEVFPLRNAWAYDVTLDTGAGVPTQISGLATTLSNLLNSGNTGSGGMGFRVGGVPRQVEGNLARAGGSQQNAPNGIPGYQGGTATQPFGPETPPAPFDGGQSGSAPGEGLTGSATTSQAQIVADVRTNSILIRDTRENMAFYAQIIRRLDVPVRVVQITAAILDVRLGYSGALGLNSIGVSTGDFGVGGATSNLLNNTVNAATGGTVSTDGDSSDNDSENSNNGLTASASTSGNNSAIASNSNLVVSGVFGTTTVTAALSALAEDNKAKILSRPTLLTLDNFGAVISQQDTFYVNSVGQYVSDLFNVSTGLSLQVVPHIIASGTGGEKLALQVRIEDGSVGGQASGTSLPTVRQATLTTQAVIHRDQSLLIGGLFVDSNQQQSSGFPGLKKIPVVGYFFSSNARAKNMVERLFLITPRIIDISSNNLGDYSEYFKPSPTVQNAINREAKPAEIRPPMTDEQYEALLPAKGRGWPAVPGGR